MPIRLHRDLERVTAGDGALPRGAQERRDARDLGPHAKGFESPPDGRRHHRGGEGQDEERHRQLDQGEAAPIPHRASQEVTSAFSPSPPGAPSAPTLHTS